MTLNERTVLYLREQLERQDAAIGKLQYATACSDRELPTALALFTMLSEVMRYTRYIRHTIEESWDCEHCKENGMIVTLDCPDDLGDIQESDYEPDEYLPEPE